MTQDEELAEGAQAYADGEAWRATWPSAKRRGWIRAQEAKAEARRRMIADTTKFNRSDYRPREASKPRTP